MIRVLSLGAGVQSSTLLLMAARGELGDVPDVALFSDTRNEPTDVYAWLDWLTEQVRGVIPVERVSKGGRSIRDDSLASARSGTRYSGPPLYTIGRDGAPAPFRRQCTKEYKLEPLWQRQRELMGMKPRQRAPKEPRVEVWLGISMDEVVRMKPSVHPWAIHRWPLIERGMDRAACLRWMERNGYPRPPRSACIICPYHSDAEWRGMKANDPQSFADAVAFDRAVRDGGARIRWAHGPAYLHRSLVPLDEVDFSTAEDRGQGNLFSDSFADECEGMCGV